MNATPALRVDNLELVLGGECRLEKLSFAVAAGDIVSVVGANGAGKTSLLRAIAGDFSSGRAMHGNILFSGKALQDLAPRERAMQMAVLAQQNTLSFPFQVREVIALGRAPHASGAANDRGIVEHCADQFDVHGLLDRVYTELSGGERQRVHLARVFAQLTHDSASRVLLLDEPMNALDYKHQQQVSDAIRTVAKNNVAVLQVMHDVNLAAKYSNRVLALKEGLLYCDCDVASFMSSENLAAVFDIDAELVQLPNHDRAILA